MEALANRAAADSMQMGKIRRIYVYSLAMATILLSRSVYFGIINLAFYRWVYYALIIVGFALLCSSMKVNVSGILRAFLLVGLLVGNVLFHLGDMSSTMLNEVIGFALDITMTSIMASYLDAKSYGKAFVNCVVLLAAISLPCVAIANFSETLAYSLVSNSYDWSVRFGYSIFYTWGINGTINVRNSGVFWEPGAFAGFLILAMLMLLHSGENHKRARAKMLILVVTLLTTRSTTGYILLVLILVAMYRDFMLLFTQGRKSSVFNFAVGTIVVIAAILVVVSSGNVADKLNGVSYLNDGYTVESADVRFSDTTNSLVLSFQAGLLGLGNTSIRAAMEASAGISQNSVGLLHLIYTYGWLFAIAYYSVFFSGVRRLFSGASTKWFACAVVVLLVLFATEGLYWLPAYLVLAFVSFGNHGSAELKHRSEVASGQDEASI